MDGTQRARDARDDDNDEWEDDDEDEDTVPDLEVANPRAWHDALGAAGWLPAYPPGMPPSSLAQTFYAAAQMPELMAETNGDPAAAVVGYLADRAGTAWDCVVEMQRRRRDRDRERIDIILAIVLTISFVVLIAAVAVAAVVIALAMGG